MVAATFNGTALMITLPAPTAGKLTVSVQEDIYSDWKVWVLDSDNSKFPEAFDTTGGDPIPGGQFISGSYFLRNDLGWRIQTSDADQEVTIIGNLYPRDETVDVYVPRAARTVSLEINLSANPRDLSSTDVTRIRKHLLNRQYTDPTANEIKDYDDDDSVLETAPIFKDDGTTPWDGTGGIQRRDQYS